MRTSTKTQRPRGRPRGFDRDTALRAAAQRFRTHGFTGTSLDELVDATGLSRPSLYAAFGDKRAIYLEALDRTRVWLEGQFAQLAALEADLEGTLKAIFAPTIEVFLTGEQGPSGCIVINTATVEAVHDPEIRERLARIIALEDQSIAAALARAGSPFPDAHGRLVTATIQSLSIRARAGAPREDLIRLAKECTATIIASSKPSR